jgi:hypothetical protein
MNKHPTMDNAKISSLKIKRSIANALTISMYFKGAMREAEARFIAAMTSSAEQIPIEVLQEDKASPV